MYAGAHTDSSNNDGAPLNKKWYIKPWEPVVRGRNAGKNIPLILCYYSVILREQIEVDTERGWTLSVWTDMQKMNHFHVNAGGGKINSINQASGLQPGCVETCLNGIVSRFLLSLRLWTVNN